MVGGGVTSNHGMQRKGGKKTFCKCRHIKNAGTRARSSAIDMGWGGVAPAVSGGGEEGAGEVETGDPTVKERGCTAGLDPFS